MSYAPLRSIFLFFPPNKNMPPGLLYQQLISFDGVVPGLLDPEAAGEPVDFLKVGYLGPFPYNAIVLNMNQNWIKAKDGNIS